MSQHLWEVSHPYYCEEGNYFEGGCHESYPSWQAFADAEADSDLDLDLLFRWDLEPPRDENGQIRFEYAENYPELRFKAYFMRQRKGFNRSARCVCARSDEPKIREWLAPRWAKMQELWLPLSSGGAA